MQCLWHLVLNASMQISSLIKVELATRDALSLISHHPLWLALSSARKLHCKLTRLVNAYNAELDLLCNRHKMYQIIYFSYSNLDSFSDADFMSMMNNWDRELVQFKLHSEVNCTKFKSCHIDWSPDVGFWLARRWLLACVKMYVTGLGTPDPCNFRQARFAPISLTLEVSLTATWWSKLRSHTRNFQNWQRTPPYSVANICLTFARQRMIEGMLLGLPSYLKY